jgi:hypothetical protein
MRLSSEVAHLGKSLAIDRRVALRLGDFCFFRSTDQGFAALASLPAPNMNETLNQDSGGTTGGRSNLAVRRILVGRDADGTGARVVVRRDAHNSETRW